MAKVSMCTLIIRDDFKNVLILQKKVKKGEEDSFALLTQKLRGKESEEKCINRAVKDSLKSIIFDLEKIQNYELSDQEEIAVYVGDLKERIVLDKAYKDYKWINKRQLDDFNLSEVEKDILSLYFEK